jgi:DNA-binding response OmpR family regulator
MAAWKTQPNPNELQTILIISRDVKMVAAWGILFKLRNCLVIHEESPRHAIQASYLISPALIIVDFDLPQSERLSLCRELRSTTQGALFVLAPKTSDDEINEYHHAGVDEYLSPAISPVSLMAKSMLWLTGQKWNPSGDQSENLYD